ncbi:MAG: LysM peptidoglycan-binding domain-containing protein [Eubacteriaceae bacterium]|nr:LysM peptidoglycan-binding domain-containing protein [Eubacteriaceae bacterium]
MYKKRGSLKIILTLLLLLSIFSSQVFAAESQLVSKVNTSTKVIALTFDDGDDGKNITKVLQILTDNKIKATFFITGKAAKAHPDLIGNINAQGSLIGNHSYAHPYFTSLTYTQIIDELALCEAAIKNITGRTTKPYFRPPYGSYNTAVLKAVGDAGYGKTIRWTIDTLDWKGISAVEITQKVLNNAVPGSIVLMHVGSGAVNTPTALPGIISGLRAKGYQFVTVAQLLTYASSSGTTYVVQSGDTLWGISRKYGVTVQQIVTANNITNANLINVGQVLIIPGISSVNPTTGIKYTVRAGDTLWGISRKYGVTVQQIASANNITNVSLIHIGQVLTIPTSTSQPPAPTSQTQYTVKAGDTLWSIAQRYGVTVQQIVTLNNIPNANLIYVNQVLLIP